MSNPKNPQNNQNQTTTTALSISPSQYSHTLSTTAISQILRSLGFKSSKSSALNTLSHLTTLFIKSLVTTAAAHATSCNRTHSNLFDYMHSIELHSLPFGFSGASAINQSLLTSKIIHELTYFISAIDDLPFPRRRSRLSSPLSSSSSSSSSSVIFGGKFDRKGDDHRHFEVPRWLPPFPEVRGDDCGGGGRDKGGKECLWEEKKVEYDAALGKKVKKRGKEVVVQGRRERLIFKLGKSSRISNVECGGGLDDLELRNGVCRGGKRICLINNFGGNDISRFFQDDACDIN